VTEQLINQLVHNRVKVLARHVMGGVGGERVWASAEEHERTVHCPLMALGMDSMASAQLKGGRELLTTCI
jgi:hypothetical protein